MPDSRPPIPVGLADELFAHVAPPIEAHDLATAEALGAEKKAAIRRSIESHTKDVTAHAETAEPRTPAPAPEPVKDAPPTKEGLDAQLLADQQREEAELEANKEKALADLDARIARQKALMDGTVLPGDATSAAEKELATQTDAEKAALQKTYTDESAANSKKMGEAIKASQEKADKQADQIIADAETEAKAIEEKGTVEGAKTMVQYHVRAGKVMADAASKASALKADDKPQDQIDTIYRDAGVASKKLIEDGTAAMKQVVDRAKADADAHRKSAKEKAGQHKAAAGPGGAGIITARTTGIKTEVDALNKGKSSLDDENRSSAEKARASAEDGRKKQRETEAAALKKLQEERKQLAERLDQQIDQQKKIIAKRTEWMRKSVAKAGPAALPQLAKSVKWCSNTQDGANATVDKSGKAQVDMAGQRIKTEAGKAVAAMAAQGKAAMAQVEADVAAAKQRIAAVGQKARSEQHAAAAQVAASIDRAAGQADAQNAARAARIKKGLADQAEACKEDVAKTGETLVKEDADKQLEAAEKRTQDIADKDWAKMQEEAAATEKELERKCGKLVTDADGIRNLYRDCAGDPDKLAMLKKAAADKGIDLDAMVNKALDKSASAMLRHAAGEGVLWHSDTADAERKEVAAYSKGDLATANVAIFQQGDQDRCDMVVDECQQGKNGQSLEQLSNDIEEQTGTKASEMMKGTLSEKKQAEVADTVKAAEDERKEKQDKALDAAAAAELKGKSPEEQQKIKEAAQEKARDIAGKLNAVLNRTAKVGNDYKVTDLMVGLSPGEIVALKAQYKAAGYGDLDEQIDKNLDGKDRKAAKAELSGDRVAAAEALIEQAADGTGTNVEMWQKAMETLKTPEERAALKARLDKHTGMSYAALNKRENSGYDRDTIAAEAIEDDDQRAASLAGVKLARFGHGGKLQQLVDGVGDTIGDELGEDDETRNKRRRITTALADAADSTNPLSAIGKLDARKSGEGYIDAMDGLTEKQMALLDADVKERTGSSLGELNAQQLSGHARKAADAFAANDRIGGKAQSMLAAGDHLINDNEDKMSKGFELNPADYAHLPPEERERRMKADRDAIRARMENDPEVVKAGGLDAYYKSQLDDTQRAAAGERIADGKVSDVTQLLLAGDTTLGFGKDTGKITEVLAKIPPGEQLEEFKRSFKARNHGQSLEEFLRSKATSDGERRDFAMLAEGNPAKLSDDELAKNPDMMIDRIKKLHEAARGGVEGFHPIDNLGNEIGNKMADLDTNTGKILDQRFQRALELEKRMQAGETLSKEETQSLITDMRAMSGDKEGFVDAKNEVVNTTAEVVGTGVEIGVDAFTGNDKLGTLAGGLTKMQIKQTLNGARYGVDEQLQDLMQIGVAELGSFAGGKLKGGPLKDILVGAGQGGLSASLDFKNMRDMGDFVTALGKGMETGGIGAAAGLGGAHFTNGSALGAGLGAAAGDVLASDDPSLQSAARAGVQAWAMHHANAHAQEKAQRAAGAGVEEKPPVAAREEAPPPVKEEAPEVRPEEKAPVRAPAPAGEAPAAPAAEAKTAPHDGPIGYTRYGEPVYAPGHPEYQKPTSIWQDGDGNWHDSSGDTMETRTEARVRDARSRMVSTTEGQKILQHWNGEGKDVEITMEPGKGSFREGNRINIDPNLPSEKAAEVAVHEGEHHRTFDRDVYDDPSATPAEKARKALRNEAEATAAQAEHAAQKGQEAHPVAEKYLEYRDEAMDRLREEFPKMTERQLRMIAREEATDRLATDFGGFVPSTSVDEKGNLIPGKPKNYQEHYEEAFADPAGGAAAAPAPSAAQLAAQAKKRPPDVDPVQAAQFEKDGYHWREVDGQKILVAPRDGMGMMVKDGQIVPREEKPLDFHARELDGERLPAGRIPAEPSGPHEVSVQEGMEGQVKRREYWRKAEEELQARYDEEVKRDPNSEAAKVMKADLERRQYYANMASRRIGEGGAILMMREKARQLGLPPEAVQLVYGGWDHPSRNSDLDMVFKVGDQLYVVEAKGGASPMGAADIKSGPDAGKRAEQGSREYLDHTIAEMEARARKENDQKTLDLVAGLRKGLADKTLEYDVIRARFEEDAAGDQRLRDVMRTRLDLYGEL